MATRQHQAEQELASEHLPIEGEDAPVAKPAPKRAAKAKSSTAGGAKLSPAERKAAAAAKAAKAKLDAQKAQRLAAIKAGLAAGETVKTIAERLHVARGTVRRQMRANSLAPSGGSRVDHSERDAKIVAAMKRGQSVAQIAEAVGLSKGRTRRIMKANGYVPRTSGARFVFASDADRRKAQRAYATLAELGRPQTVIRAIERAAAK